ncbi:ABC transporter permease [Xylocopilactobacillus apicola]|uniref:ABC transporter n=1 Tax=Xylocopilactobacillus apicola TaxID=2932184 RepID=A0AAU9DH23_9LACO|nr:ABC transporter permease [Xylocopilactobacillus apicola]BDR57586.1 ABC transporter [Xylocopilactobacillus apicola]
MINQLRAEMYRQFHTKGNYLLTIFVICYSALTTFYKSVGGVVMTGGIQHALEEIDTTNWSVLTGVKFLTMGSSLLIYVFISIFVMVIGTEFSQNTYKNTLISGISRLQFIVVKYLTMLINILLQVFVFYLTGIITGLLCGRKLGSSWGYLLSTTFTTTFVTTFFISVIFGMAIVLLILTSLSIVSAVFIVLFPVLVNLVTTVTKWDWLKYLDFFGVSNKIALKLITLNQFLPYILTSCLILLICFIISLLLFQRKEL